MNFQNCYKVLIESLCDWTNWTGKYAKVLDDCNASDDEDVNLWTYSPSAVSSDIERYTWGDGTSSGKLCWKSPLALKLAVPTLIEYFGSSAVGFSGSYSTH